MKTTIPLITYGMNRFPTRCAVLIISTVLASFVFLPAARAVSPAPDGGYPSGNTAEGTDALFSLTFGAWNTALGYQAQYKNATGNQNTATGYQTLFSNFFGNKNTAYGAQALYNHVIGDFNTATGFRTLYTDTEGSANTGDGFEALAFNTDGFLNTADGAQALYHNTAGGANTGVGFQALFQNTTGSGNIALGSGAGMNLTTGDNNIDIGNPGAAGEANTVRIGTQGTQTETFIAGISGTPVSGAAVVVNAGGQLGVAPSSERFKNDIKSMDMASEAILALRPVTFRYKEGIDPNRTAQFGLVAEEVERVNPDLVSHDVKGNPYTVRYEAVNAMLLNEFLKEHKKTEKLEATVASLMATVKEQAAQIQKVSAQLEATEFATGRIRGGGPAPQVVNNP